MVQHSNTQAVMCFKIGFKKLKRLGNRSDCIGNKIQLNFLNTLSFLTLAAFPCRLVTYLPADHLPFTTFNPRFMNYPSPLHAHWQLGKWYVMLLLILGTGKESLAQGIGQEGSPWPRFKPDNYQQLLLNRSWRFTLGDSAQFAKPAFNDKNWGTKLTGAYWRDVRNATFWLRQSFYLPQKPINSSKDSVILDLGRIDDADECFLNGKRIGKGGNIPPGCISAWNVHRYYKVHINDTILKWGKPNLIALRVYNQGNVGGLTSRWQRVLVPKPFDHLCLQLPNQLSQWELNPKSGRQRQTIWLDNPSNDSIQGQLMVQVRRYGANDASQTMGMSATLLPRQATALSLMIPTDVPAKWYAIVSFESQKQQWVDTVTIAIVTERRPAIVRPAPSQQLRDSIYLIRPVVSAIMTDSTMASRTSCNTDSLDWAPAPIHLNMRKAQWQTILTMASDWAKLSHDNAGPDVLSPKFDALLQELQLAMLTNDTVALWQAGNLFIAMQRPDGSLRPSEWADYEMPGFIQVQYAQLASLAADVFKQTGFAPWLDLAKGLGQYHLESFGSLPYKTNLSAADTRTIMQTAAWLLPLAKLDQLLGSKRNEIWRDAAFDVIRKLDEGNGPRTIGGALSLASHADYLNAEPVAYLMSLRGIWRLSLLHNRGIWKQAITFASEDLRRYLILNQHKLASGKVQPSWTAPASAAELTALFCDLGRYGGEDLQNISRCGLYKEDYLKWLFVKKRVRGSAYSTTAYNLATRAYSYRVARMSLD